jgi:putative oxidoreductase
MLLGRVLMSVIFILGGLGKMADPASTMAMLGQHGLPMPDAAYAVAVFVEFIGGLALLLGFATPGAAAVLGFWCIATALVAHTNFADRNMMIHFMKNLAMAGGCAYIAAFGAGTYSVDNLRARRRVSFAA